MHSIFLPQSNRGLALEGSKPVSTAPSPVPFDQWPFWAKAIAADRATGEAGVGDTAERIIGPVISVAFKKWYQETFGKACGCERRKAEWNAKYRYTD